jgi:hypothetical protein
MGKKMKSGIIYLIILFLVSGCVKQDLNSEPVQQQETKEVFKEPENFCKNVDIEYLISNIETEIIPRPNEAYREYDSGILKFNLLNKDNKINGYFNVSIVCVMPDGNTKEYAYVNLQKGAREDIRLQCSKRGMILSIEGPTIESAPQKEVCA